MISYLIDTLGGIVRQEMNGGTLRGFVSARYGPAQVVPTTEQPAILYNIKDLDSVCGGSAFPTLKVNFDFWGTAAPTTNPQEAALRAHSLLWNYIVEDAKKADIGLLPFALYMQGRMLPADDMGRSWRFFFDSAPKTYTSQADQNVIGSVWLRLSAVMKVNLIVRS